MTASRLYVVFERPMPEDALREHFDNAAPGLEYVSRHGEKLFCFVKYTTEEAAKLAKQTLDGATVNGQKLKISIADPPRAASTSRKRPRISEHKSG